MLNIARKKIASLFLLIFNVTRFCLLKKIENSVVGQIRYRGASYSDITALGKVYRELNNRSFSLSQRVLLRLCGNCKKMVMVAESMDAKPRVLGMNLYYLNFRDVKEHTVHEGFIGVIPDAAGQGVASQMRTLAGEHFKNEAFYGISTRISKGNLGSLRSAEKLGFEPIEEYLDSETNEYRYYMIRDLRK